MAERLKSILKRTHWSLLLKALAFGVGWFLFPKWLALIWALVLYCVPWFSPRTFLIPFVITLALGLWLPATFLAVILLTAMFFVVMGLKELVFVERVQIYEGLLFFLLLVVLLSVYGRFDHWNEHMPFLWLVIPVVCFMILARDFFLYCRSVEESAAQRVSPGLLAVLGGFFLWQVSIAALLLPIAFFYEAALVFALAVVWIELGKEYLVGMLQKKTLYLYGGGFLAASVLILVLAEWRL